MTGVAPSHDLRNQMSPISAVPLISKLDLASFCSSFVATNLAVLVHNDQSYHSATSADNCFFSEQTIVHHMLISK